jgi:hypothetical protein
MSVGFGSTKYLSPVAIVDIGFFVAGLPQGSNIRIESPAQAQPGTSEVFSLTRSDSIYGHNNAIRLSVPAG